MANNDRDVMFGQGRNRVQEAQEAEDLGKRKRFYEGFEEYWI